MSAVKFILSLHIFAFLLGAIVFWALLTNRFPFPGNPPVIEPKWFGSGSRPQTESVAIQPFKINVDDKVLEDLKARLKLDLVRLESSHPSPLEDSAFNYGFNTDYLIQTLGKYWLNDYDWRKQEKMLNQFPQFKTNLDGLDIHFIHLKPDPVKSKGKKVLPLLIGHGWPGSVVEFVKILPMLTTPRADRDFVFEVVAPSLPGYGFSSAPTKMGFHFGHCARIFVDLMKRLGHETFYTQGGDWGALVTQALATSFSKNVRGMHLNMAAAQTASANLKLLLAQVFPSLLLKPEDYKKVIPLGEKFRFILNEMGYMHLQATKPDTAGIGLNTSPIGLAAYIIEKFSTWTDKEYRNFPDGKLTEKFSLDELLNNVMIYWISGSITSSMRFYAENIASNRDYIQANDNAPTFVPTGIAACPNELFVQPESFLEGKFKNIVSYNDMERCGHFAAYEEPKLIADDVFAFVDKVEKMNEDKSAQQEKEL